MLRYSELVNLKTFSERFNYLKLDGVVGKETFGLYRYLNQKFYKTPRWKKIRKEVIIRDNGCDLGIDGETIGGLIYIHHLNPISLEDLIKESEFLLSPEFLICASYDTHNAIHYGDENLIVKAPIERKPFDTCPWRLNK